MAFPGKKLFKQKEGLCHITAALMNRIINMLDGLEIVMTDGQDQASIDTPASDGTGWKFNIPSSGAGKITVESSDGDQSIEDVDKLIFDADHFVLVDEGDGQAALAVNVEEQEIVTDVRYDSTTKQLQKKTRTVKIIPVEGEAESDWTMITGGQAEACP
jgi:hypothetical protein